MNQVYPYSDESMVYDDEHHRYILTEECVYNELGINLSTELNTLGSANNTAVVQRVLNKVSRTLYTWLYSRGGNTNWQEYMLAKYAPLRPIIKEMLITLLEYMLEEGAVGARSGINYAKGTYIERDIIRKAQVPIEVEEMANQILPCGVSILYLGLNVCVPCGMYRRGY